MFDRPDADLWWPGDGPFTASRFLADPRAVSLPPMTSSIVDDFADGTVDTDRWFNSYGAITESGGRGQIPCGTGYAAFATRGIYRFDYVHAQVFVPAVNGGSTDVYTDFFIQSVSANAAVAGTDIGFFIDHVANVLYCVNWVGFFDGTAVSLTYSATSHAWLRLRRNSGDLYWETSPDGLTWTIRRTMSSPPAWVDNADILVYVECHRGDGTANFGELDNVNVTPTAAVTDVPPLFSPRTRRPALRPARSRLALAPPR